jgi:hypothetical protein
MNYQLAKVVVACGLTFSLLGGAAAHAQVDAAIDPSTWQHDAQLFAPGETDLDGLLIGQENRGGVFFSWEKLYWSTEGELITVGDPNISRALPPTWMDLLSPDNPLTALPGFIMPALQPIDPVTGRPRNPDTGAFIQRPIYINSIQEVGPNASFRSADRFEFGYNNEDHGWLVGILNGPEQQFGQFFGLNGGAQEGFAFDPVNFPNGAMSPLGDVYIAFDYEPGLMHGFQDLWQAGAVDPTGRVLPDDVNADGILDGDGFADDIDGDGQYGPDGFDVNLPALEPDSFPQPIPVPFPATASGPPDYDDLVELPTAFRTVLVRNAATTNGIELMAMHRLDNRHWQAKHKQYNNIEFYYGVRYLRFRDNFVVNADGGVLGASVWDTQIINNIVGPQLGMQWTQTRGRWSGQVNGRFTFGYNVSNWDQDGFIGEDLIPGAPNHPLYLRPHSFKYGRRDDDFSPIAEMRMEVAYNFTRSVALKAGWTGMYVGNVYRASTHVRYHIPNMGFLLGNPEHVIINGVNGGLEFNY